MQQITISPSVLLAAVIGLTHLTAAGLTWLIPIPVVGKSVFTMAIAISLVYFMARDAALHAAGSIVALEIGEEGAMAFQTRDGAWFDCELLGTSYVSPRLTIVHLRPRDRRVMRRVILVPDNVDPQDFRRLRTWLRWKSGLP